MVVGFRRHTTSWFVARLQLFLLVQLVGISTWYGGIGCCDAVSYTGPSGWDVLLGQDSFVGGARQPQPSSLGGVSSLLLPTILGEGLHHQVRIVQDGIQWSTTGNDNHYNHNGNEDDIHDDADDGLLELGLGIHPPKQYGRSLSSSSSSTTTTSSTRLGLLLTLPKYDPIDTTHGFTRGRETTPNSHTTQTTTTTTPSSLKLRSTGTTIAGLVLDDGTIILGADTRATDDRMVADKQCEKIHPLVPNQIYACGAGTSGDLEAVTRQIRYSMQLQQLQDDSIGNRYTTTTTGTSGEGGSSSNKSVTIHHVCKWIKDHLYESGGSLGVNLILGAAGSRTLVAIHPHGSMEQVPYAALGSGGLAAMGVLEQRYKPNLSLQQAMKLVARAIKAGIENDLGSGSQVDLCILNKDGSVQYLRAAVPAEQDLKSNDIVLIDAAGGVNGFGNLPYLEQRRRTLLLDDEQMDWDSVLGL